MGYFPYDVKLRLLAHSQSFLANQKARNAIVGAENLLITVTLVLTPYVFQNLSDSTIELSVTNISELIPMEGTCVSRSVVMLSLAHIYIA